MILPLDLCRQRGLHQPRPRDGGQGARAQVAVPPVAAAGGAEIQIFSACAQIFFLQAVSAKRLGHHSRAASALSVTGGGAGGRSSRQHRHTPAPGNGALSYR